MIVTDPEEKRRMIGAVLRHELPWDDIKGFLEEIREEIEEDACVPGIGDLQ